MMPKLSQMRPWISRRRLTAYAIACSILAGMICLYVRLDFHARWRNLKDGMSQAEVRQTLGNPSSIGKSGTIGAGNQLVIRWDYKRGRHHYCVDFDYISPG